MFQLDDIRSSRFFFPAVTWTIVALFLFVFYSPAARAVTEAVQRGGDEREVSIEQRLAKTLREMKIVARRAAGDDDTATLATLTSAAAAERLLALRDDVLDLQEALQERFDATLAKLQDAGSPPEILARHHATVELYQTRLEVLLAYVATVEAAADETARAAAIQSLSDYLETQQFQTRHQRLNPEKLPHRPADRERRSPRESKDEFSEMQPVVHLAATTLSPLMLAQADAPTAEDLGESTEIVLTPGITALAASLGTPSAIYDWVRSNILFVPTFGSIQGADGCRLSRECNAFDTASLLIALLRANSVPARYVKGTVEVPPALFMSLMGDFQDLTAAANLAASGGIPVVTINGPGGPEAVRFETVWVEALIDYTPSRGAIPSSDGDRWVRLDPTIKPTEFVPPMDVQAALGVDFQSAFGDDLANTATVNPDGSAVGMDMTLASTRLEGFVNDFTAYAQANMPDITIGEYQGETRIDVQPLGVLPASLPATVVSESTAAAELPDSDRHKVTLGIYTLDTFGFETLQTQVQWPTAELANKRITVSYVPASQADADLIETYGGYYEVPPNLMQVRPVILVEGVQAAAGSAVMLGSDQLIRVTFFEPGAGSDSVQHTVPAGTYAALGLDLQRISPEQLQERRDRYDQTRQLLDWGLDPANIPDVTVPWDDILGEKLHLHAQTYFMQVESGNRTTANASNVVAIKRPAELLSTFRPTIVYGLFGVPVDIDNLGMSVDAQRYIASSGSRVGNTDAERSYLLAAGTWGSTMEHLVFEQLHDSANNLDADENPTERLEAVSTMKLLRLANEQGVPIFFVDSSNVGDVLPLLNLDADVESDISSSVAAGKQVLVSQRNLTLNEWTGAGYMVMDPDTGAAAFLISGGLNGGSSSDSSWFGDLIGSFTQAVTYLANLGGGLLPALIATSKFFTGAAALANLKKLDKVFGAFGKFVIGLSALVTFFSVLADPNGSLLDATIAGAADLILSLLIMKLTAWLLTFAFFTGGIFGFIVLIAILALVTALAIWLIGLLTQYLTSAFLRMDHRRTMYAFGPLLRALYDYFRTGFDRLRAPAPALA